jgi:hypothetical protein
MHLDWYWCFSCICVYTYIYKYYLKKTWNEGGVFLYIHMPYFRPYILYIHTYIRINISYTPGFTCGPCGCSPIQSTYMYTYMCIEIINIYICIYIYIYIYICVYTYIHTYKYICVHIPQDLPVALAGVVLFKDHICTYMYIHIDSHLYIYLYMYNWQHTRHSYTPEFTGGPSGCSPIQGTYMHIYAYICIHKYCIYTFIHIYIWTHR